jgi:hydrogenase maturation factor
MTLIYGEVVELLAEDGVRMGKIRVGGALTKVTMELVAEAKPGDVVLLCDGVAIGKAQEEINYVSGHSR